MRYKDGVNEKGSSVPSSSSPPSRLRAAAQSPLVWIALAYLVLAGLYFRATPPLEASDEAGHFSAALFVKHQHRLPVADPADPSPTRSQEHAQPPLYYVLAALLIHPVDTSNHLDFYAFRAGAPVGRADIPGPKNMFEMRGDRSFPWKKTMLAVAVLRGFSIVLGLGTVLVTFILVRRVFPADPRTAAFAACMVAFNPMFLFISSSVNNDNLAVFLVSAGCVILMRARERGFTFRSVIAVALICGAAMLTKASGVLLAILALAMVMSSPQPWKARLLKAAALAAIIGLATGWWLARNRQLYGEWFGFGRQALMACNLRPCMDPFALFREWDGFVKSYWGVFGGFNVIFPDGVYIAFYAMTVAGLAAAAGATVRFRSQGAPWLAALLVLNFAACAVWTSWNTGSQGRLLFYSIAPTAALAASGTLSAGRRAGMAAAVGATVLMLAFALYGAIAVIPSQYP